MRKLFAALALLFCVLVTQSAQAVTVWYQPAPYPVKQADGTSMPTDITIRHFWEGWVAVDGNSVPIQQNGTTLQQPNSQNSWLYVGGNGNQYLTFMKFDLTGLPKQVDSAVFYLDPGAVSSPWTSTPYGVCPVLGPWNGISSWAALPPVGQCADWYPAPVANTWAYFCATNGCGCTWCDWYTQWQNGTLANNGVMIHAQNLSNGMDPFVSSATDPAYDGARPILGLTFTPTLELKMPLKGLQGPEKLSWLVTTEVGGYDCLGHVADGSNDPWPDPYHTDSTSPGNYFSIDFSWQNKDVNGVQVYSSSDNIPVLAAADGTTTIFPLGQPGQVPDNGNFVVVTHGTTGFTTRYLHLKTIVVSNNATVTQGTLLGYMGNTGKSKGIHLHFGVRFNGNGLSTTSELAKVVMDGLLLKSYHTECAVDANGVPTSRIRNYPSSNY
ncbi:MAG: peptidoglycan DD-metalloendopeptidase family protein [Minisyncoccota bacterium]